MFNCFKITSKTQLFFRLLLFSCSYSRALHIGWLKSLKYIFRFTEQSIFSKSPQGYRTSFRLFCSSTDKFAFDGSIGQTVTWQYDHLSSRVVSLTVCIFVCSKLSYAITSALKTCQSLLLVEAHCKNKSKWNATKRNIAIINWLVSWKFCLNTLSPYYVLRILSVSYIITYVYVGIEYE